MSSEEQASAYKHVPELGDESPIGRMVGGKYQVLGFLGKGGMSAVYRVNQVFLNKEMALKLLDTSKVSSNLQIRRFQQEAKAANSLSHASLVKVHDFGFLDSGEPYLVMDMIEGETLSNYLKRNGPMPLQDINSVFAQVCFGLSCAHSDKIVHRDIKPGNIMLVKGTSFDTEGSVKIVDFGLAKILGDDDGMQALTQTGEVMGSPIYMSPEQCSGQALDHRSDIYSLGCVLFEALTGTPPFIGESVLRTMMLHQTGSSPTLKEASLGRQFPPALEHIVAKMLAKSPNDRYQDLGVVAHELADACRGGVNRQAEPKIAMPIHKAKPKKPDRKVTMTKLQFAALMTCTVVASMVATALTVSCMAPLQQGSPASVNEAPAAVSRQQDNSQRAVNSTPFLQSEDAINIWETGKRKRVNIGHAMNGYPSASSPAPSVHSPTQEQK